MPFTMFRASVQPRMVEVTVDRDGHYKITDERAHEIHGRATRKGRVMSHKIFWCAVIVLATSIGLSSQGSKVYRGEIADSECALNIHSLTHSHQEMLKSKSMGGTAATCTLYCIEHMGGYLVLSAGKNIFRLDRPDIVHGYEGQKVKITGVFDSKINQIHVLKIELDNDNSK